MEVEIVRDILISIVAAAGFAYVAHRFRQPAILGYILAGVLIGPKLGLGWVSNAESIEVLSELGLIMLLFMIGLEIDPRKFLQSGRTVAITGSLQVGLCVLLGLVFFSVLGVGEGRYAVLYLALVFAISSTMIVVNLLYDKFELDTMPGRLTLGILVVQDLFSIIMLGIQPSLGDADLKTLAISLLAGTGLVAGSFVAGRFVLPRLLGSVGKAPELMVAVALAWCFLVAWLAGDVAGFSRAVGALVAGVTLSTLPYSAEITTKVTSIRSFFVILFFVSLGMKVAEPSVPIFLASLAASAFLVLSRFVVLFPTLYFQQTGIRVSVLVPLNLTQISEFSLVIVALGLSYGHIDESVVTIVLFTLMITATTSTYMITYSHTLYAATKRVLTRLGLKDLEGEEKTEESDRPILLLGFHRIASSLLRSMESRDPSAREKIAVVDFNPEVHRELVRRGVRATYGDLSNTDALVHGGVARAKAVVSTIPDTILKGTTNAALLSYTRRVNPGARVVVTAETTAAAKRLWAAGADFVLLPAMEASDRLAGLLEGLLGDEAPEECSRERQRIMELEGEVVR